jgi:hypothetical protein
MKVMETVSPRDISVLTLLAASQGNAEQINEILSTVKLEDLSVAAQAKAREIIESASADKGQPAEGQSPASELLDWAESNRRLMAKRQR